MQKQTIALLVIVLAILGVVYIMGVANLQTPSTGFNVIDAIKSVFRGAPSCTTGYKCYSATVLGYQNRKCKWSNFVACKNGCLNDACVPSATCKEIFSCSGTILVHQLTNCTNLTQNCPNGCVNNACKPDPCAGVSCPNVCQDANNLKTNGNCVAGACQYTTISCAYGCNTTANNKCNLPPAPQCTIDAQCGSVTCSGNSLITPKCTGGICTNQSSVCTYGCSNNACNSAPSNASKIEIGVDAYTEHIATEPSKLTYVYKYVVGQGWQSYVTSYIAEAYKYNFKPVIVFYTNFDTGNPDFTAWDQVMNAIKTDGRQVWVVVEPDMWGYIRNDGTCGSVGKQHVTRFLSTKPSNAHLGFFISPWNLPYNGATYDANDWYNCWTAAGGNQMEDIYVDVSDRDQETYGTYPWASSKITLYEDWFKALNADTGRKMSVWQIPMGNSQCLNGKRSNLVETWLTPSKLTALSPYVNRLLFGPGDEGNAGDPQSWNIQNYAKYDCGYFNQRVAAVG